MKGVLQGHNGARPRRVNSPIPDGPQERDPPLTEHRYLGVESTPRRMVAICSCGWRSEPYSSAGMAGSAWDRHSEEEAPS
ncbi:MAG: hypothetical protein JWN67_4207 [Actinomycetia bacterium]|nr:hypothetical protein [Actinomycetes bacterium]